MAGLASSIQHHHMQKTNKLRPGENAGDPRSNCGVRDFPDDSRLCWSHRIPSQVNFNLKFSISIKLGHAGLIGLLLRSISHFCPTFSAPFPDNYQVDHAVDDHPGGGDDWHLALRRGQLLFSGQLGHCHPVRSFSSTSSSL